MPISAQGGDPATNCDCGATNAMDGDLLSLAVVYTGNGADWLKFNFGKTFHIQEVLIYHRFYTNWYNPAQKCAESEDRFRSCINS